MGLAGVAQVVRLTREVEHLRQGQVTKRSREVAFAITSDTPQEAPPKRLLALSRDHWSIENGQHYRRDRTQDEDRCNIRETTTARNLSLFRSLAIFLFKAQAGRRGGKKSLPDFERHVHRLPWTLIPRLIPARHEE